MDMDEVIKTVSESTGVSISDILSRKRTQDVCEARQMFSYIVYKRFGVSLANIALYLRRTHQTISFQIITLDQQIRIYKGLRNKIEEIEKILFYICND